MHLKRSSVNFRSFSIERELSKDTTAQEKILWGSCNVMPTIFHDPFLGTLK